MEMKRSKSFIARSVFEAGDGFAVFGSLYIGRTWEIQHEAAVFAARFKPFFKMEVTFRKQELRLFHIARARAGRKNFLEGFLHLAVVAGLEFLFRRSVAFLAHSGAVSAALRRSAGRKKNRGRGEQWKS